MESHEKNLLNARAFVGAIEAGDLSAMVALCCDDIVQIAWPNRLNEAGEKRDLAGMIDGFERGKKILVRQSYDITSAFSSANGVALEMVWRGELAIAIDDLGPGDEMVGHMAMFLTFRAGKIATCHNYDCFEPF